MKVIRSFIDRESHKVFAVGDTFTHSDPQRLKFLVSKGYLAEDDKTPTEEIKEPKTTEETPKKATRNTTARGKKAAGRSKSKKG